MTAPTAPATAERRFWSAHDEAVKHLKDDGAGYCCSGPRLCPTGQALEDAAAEAGQAWTREGKRW